MTKIIDSYILPTIFRKTFLWKQAGHAYGRL